MLEVSPIKAFFDNYLWLFSQPGSRLCGIVDPGDAEPVLKHLRKNELELAVIIITHHHADHTGGIKRLLEEFDVPVYGPDSPNIPSITHPLAEGDQIEILGQAFRVLEIPGHTLDHIAYVAEGDTGQASILFCGDTLFAGGCGRVFEGTHSMMLKSLEKLAGLDSDTRVYCAHEYTMANLAFASAVSPDNALLAERVQREQGKRDLSLPTVPTSIGMELATNPFLRCHEDELVQAASKHCGEPLSKPEEVFAAIRSWKDTF